VLSRLTDLARTSGRRFLCGPPLGGWVGAYPNERGQDEQVAAELANQWPGELLYLAVHVLLRDGFEAGERYSIPALDQMRLQFLAKPSASLNARVMSIKGQEATLSISSERADGTSYTLTTRPDLGLDRPPGQVVGHLARTSDVRNLLDLMLRARGEGPWLALTASELPAAFERAYERGRDWRDERGFTDAEASRFVLNQLGRSAQ
jgi:hypothetical protein